MLFVRKMCREEKWLVENRKGSTLKRIVVIIAVTLTMSTMAMAQGQSAYELRQSWQQIADLISATGRDTAAARIEKSVSALSDEELERVYGQVNLDNMINALRDITGAMDAIESMNGAISVNEFGKGNTPDTSEMMEKSIVPMTFDFNGFPTDLDYPDPNYCPLSPGRSNGLALQIAVDATQAARIALEVAKGVWSGLSRACDETVVVVGEGGNTSLACIPADIVLFVAEGLVGAAEGIVEHFEACDNGVDSAEIEGTWKGLGYINSVLEAHIGQLTIHDEDIKSEIALIHDRLDTQKGMLEAVLANQQMIMQLLKTPNGKRPNWNK